MNVKMTCTAALLAIAAPGAWGQTPKERTYSINELIDLAISNNQALKLSAASVEVSQQRVLVAKTQQFPNVSASASAFYLGDATIYDANLSKKATVPMPHFGNSLTLQASQLIFKGNAVRNAIGAADLQQQLAALSLEKNKQDIKLLVASYYLELFRLRNQHIIYQKNIELSEVRLKNISKMHQQGLVTQNDVIRTRLLISNLNQACSQLQNNIDILNRQLTMATGLPADAAIVPDTTILANRPNLESLEQYQSEAAAGGFDIKLSEKSVQIAERSLAIAKADRMPTLSLYAANSLQRPITTSTPVLDMYSNGWQVGATVSFNLASLYNAPRSIKLSNLQLVQSQQNVVLQQQNTELAVHAAYLKHLDALKQQETATVNLQLAQENYKTMEKKYLNQLALLLDMLDATNAKLDAELQDTNTQIGIVFTYYKLLNAAGKL
jgi:outer membrane protein